MSTTGKADDAGNPGEAGFWKDGFNLDVKLIPLPMLLARETPGPWLVVERPRLKNEKWEVRRGADGPCAWKGAELWLAKQLCVRFNGYEYARDFPPKPIE